VAAADPALPKDVVERLGDLVVAAETVAQQLGDEEATADLEELAGALQRVDSTARELLAMAPDHPGLRSACAHLREARDLIDDGMPADAAAFEVLAATARLEASLEPS
jgi:hypothetical protein